MDNESGAIAMSDHPHIKNIIEPVINPGGYGMGYGGAGLGAGAGGLAGIAGGVLGGLLTRGGFLGGGERVGEFVTPMQLQTATGSIIDSNQNTTLLQAVGDTKLAVATTGAAVQIAADANTQAIRTHLGQVENTIGMMASNNLQAINGVNVNVLTSAAATREAVAQYGQANISATKDASAANLAAIAASTSTLLAALKDGQIATLQRELTVAELRNSEDRAEARARSTEVNVTQTVNQNQMQLQAQAQQQQQAVLLGQLVAVVGNLQNAVATNSNLIVGNTGAVATGPQTANPVNVRT